MQPGSRMNISFCWLDYKEKNPDGYEKSHEYYGSNVPLFRRNGYRQSGTMIP